MKLNKFPLVFLTAFGLMMCAVSSYAISLDLSGSLKNVPKGAEFTVNIMATEISDLDGIAVTLTYPEDVVFLSYPAVTTGFFKTNQKDLIESEGGDSVWSAGRTGPPGTLYLTGLSMSHLTDGVDPGKATLFSIHFIVSPDAPAGIQVIRLARNRLCNGPAGWGTDINNNGIFDKNDNDAREDAPLLYSFVLDSGAGQDDIDRIETEILMDGFDDAPFFVFNVLDRQVPVTDPGDGTGDGSDGGGVPENPAIDSDNDGVSDDNDGCPDDPSKTEPGACGCGVSDADSDNDGIPDCSDVLIRPANGEMNTALNPVFEVEPFPNPGVGDVIEWQISPESSFTDLLFQYTGPFDVTMIQLPDFILDEFTTYYWRIRYGTGPWETTGEFTTGPDPMTDEDDNGIPDNQDIWGNEVQANLIKADDNGKVLQAEENGMQFSLITAEGVAGIERFKWQGQEFFETAGSWPVNFADGLLSFRLRTTVVGATVIITVGFSEEMPIGSGWWKTTVEQVVVDFGQYAVFADDMRSVTLTLTDGGPGDLDGAANGVIVDPGGIVRPETGSGTGTNSGGGGGSSGCFIETCLFPEN